MGKKYLENVTLIGIDCLDLERINLAMHICQEDFIFGNVKLLTSLPFDQKNIVKIEPIISVEDYSHFIISKLDRYLETTHALIVQYDGFILNSSAWTDKFLEYDYIGAPWLVADWSVRDYGFPEELLGKLVVGNGGFSLRSKKLTSLCAKLAKEKVFSKYHPEDVVLAVHNRKILEDNQIKFAPVEIAKQFSFEAETDENDVWNGQFGFHGFAWTDISKWLEKHPKYMLDKKLNVLGCSN